MDKRLEEDAGILELYAKAILCRVKVRKLHFLAPTSRG
jgi:hypothetical protein